MKQEVWLALIGALQSIACFCALCVLCARHKIYPVVLCVRCARQKSYTRSQFDNREDSGYNRFAFTVNPITICAWVRQEKDAIWRLQ